ncbi:MAG: hypothetical protein K0U82_22825, partial [Planctomycetes bacterium]|nr:hypothetical protein [Planctomycetota bacterium]
VAKKYSWGSVSSQRHCCVDTPHKFMPRLVRVADLRFFHRQALKINLIKQANPQCLDLSAGLF